MQNLLLPFLLAAIGWLFTNAIEEFSNDKIVSYHVDNYDIENRNTDILLRNISPTRQNTSFQLGIACRETSNCFENRFGQFFGLERRQPHFVKVDKDDSLTSTDMIFMNIIMPFDSELRIISYHPEYIDGYKYETFLILEDNSNLGQIFIENNNPLRYIIEHRITIYFSLFLFILIIIILLYFHKYASFNKKSTD